MLAKSRVGKSFRGPNYSSIGLDKLSDNRNSNAVCPLLTVLQLRGDFEERLQLQRHLLLWPLPSHPSGFGFSPGGTPTGGASSLQPLQHLPLGLEQRPSGVEHLSVDPGEPFGYPSITSECLRAHQESPCGLGSLIPERALLCQGCTWRRPG